MATMNNMLDSMLEGQRKMLDFWKDATTKMMEAPAAAATVVTEEKTEEKNLVKEWYDQQQSFMDEMAKLGTDMEDWTKAPELYQKWLGMQMNYLEKWNSMTIPNWKGMNMDMFDMSTFGNNFPGSKTMKESWEQWKGAVEKNNTWIKEQVLDKLPEAMKTHYSNFTETYEDLYKQWDNFQRSIQFGMFDPKSIASFFPTSNYQKMIDRMMGFYSMGDMNKMMDSVNDFFKQYMQMAEGFQPNVKEWEETWKNFSKMYVGNGDQDYYQMLLNLNQQVNDSTAPYINMMGQGKASRLAKLIKDLQFNYNAFLIKNSEMQSLVYQAGQFALPKTLQSLNESYKASDKMPEFNTFLNQFIESLEGHINEVLQSDKYSVLQSEVVKLGTSARKKMDELVEASFDQTPFLMRTDGDDLAKEIQTLRKKVRDLEKQVSGTVEEAVETAVETVMN